LTRKNIGTSQLAIKTTCPKVFGKQVFRLAKKIFFYFPLIFFIEICCFLSVGFIVNFAVLALESSCLYLGHSWFLLSMVDAKVVALEGEVGTRG
jgi:hypothetical protein